MREVWYDMGYQEPQRFQCHQHLPRRHHIDGMVSAAEIWRSLLAIRCPEHKRRCSSAEGHVGNNARELRRNAIPVVYKGDEAGERRSLLVRDFGGGIPRPLTRTQQYRMGRAIN